MPIDQNHFVLGDMEFVRNEKTSRCYRVDENGKKVRISNLDYEEYLEEAERWEHEAEEVPEVVESPSNECEDADSIHDAENFKFYADIAVRADDNPVLLAQQIIMALKNNQGVTLSSVGIRAVANAAQAVNYTENCLKCTIPCMVSHKKFFARDGRELDSLSLIVYPEFTIYGQQNMLSTVTLNKIMALCKSYQAQVEESAPFEGADISEADKNQLVFPWVNGGANLT